MKKIFSALILFALIFTGCSNSDSVSEKFLLASILTQQEQGTEYKICLKQSENTRTIVPDNSVFEECFSDIKWNVYFYPSTSVEKNYREAKPFYINDVFADENGYIKFRTIRKGIYDINLSGTYTNPSTEETLYFNAYKNNIDISASKNLEVEVSSVQLGTGSFEIKVSFDAEKWNLVSINSETVEINIEPLSKNVIDSVTEEHPFNELYPYTFERSEILDSNDELESIVLTVKPSPDTTSYNSDYPYLSGFYKINVSLNNYLSKDGNVSSLENIPLSDSVFAVSNFKKTTGTVEAYYSYSINTVQSVYYANMDPESTGNGLYLETAGYVWNIIDTIKKGNWSYTAGGDAAPSATVFCSDFVMNSNEYNRIFNISDEEKEQYSFFQGGFIIRIVTSLGYYEITSSSGSAYIKPFQKIQVTGTEPVTMILGQSMYANTCYFKGTSCIESGAVHFSNFYFDNLSTYLSKGTSSDKPFMRILKSCEEAERIFYADFTLNLDPDVSGASIYIYDEAKKTYNYDPTYGIYVVQEKDSNGEVIAANLYLKRLGMIKISEKASYYSLKIKAVAEYTGDLEGVVGTVAGVSSEVKQLSCDWQEGADKSIAFTALYNNAVTPDSIKWLLNGTTYSESTDSQIEIPLSYFVAGTTNQVSCTLNCGDDQVTSYINVQLNEDSSGLYKNWISYKDPLCQDSKYSIKYYTETLDNNDNIGKTAFDQKVLSIDVDYTIGDDDTCIWNHWNLNDGYLYISKNILNAGEQVSYVSYAYKMNPFTKTVDTGENLFSSLFNSYLPSKYYVFDITMDGGYYYLLIYDYDNSGYRILRTDSIVYKEGSFISMTAGSEVITFSGELSDPSRFAVKGTNLYFLLKEKGVYKTQMTMDSEGYIGVEESDRYVTMDSCVMGDNGGSYPIGTIEDPESANKFYTDMVIIGQSLYVTLWAYRQVEDITYTYMGGIAEYTINSDGSLTQAGLYGVPVSSAGTTSDGNNYTRYAPVGANPTEFYGIKKILAATDNYLLLQDSGLDLVDADNKVFNSIDRVVYFDLSNSNKAIDTTKTRTGLFMCEKNFTNGSVIVVY